MTPSTNSTIVAGQVGTSCRRAGGRFATGHWRSRLRRFAEDNTGRLRDDSGFTLAEVIVSILLFTIMSFAVMFALVTLIKYTSVTQNRVAASNLARQEVERLRGQNSTLSLLDAGPSSVTLKGTTYTVTPILSPAANASCAPGAARNATVTVSWNGSGSRTVRYDTVLSC